MIICAVTRPAITSVRRRRRRHVPADRQTTPTIHFDTPICRHRPSAKRTARADTRLFRASPRTDVAASPLLCRSAGVGLSPNIFKALYAQYFAVFFIHATCNGFLDGVHKIVVTESWVLSPSEWEQAP